MKPAWDQLANSHKNSDIVSILDVDCTAAGQSLCQQVGVSGYPSIKYYLPGSKVAKDYQGGRDFNALKSFTESTFKAMCDPFTSKGCNDQEKRFIEKNRDKTPEDLTKEVAAKNEELAALKKERTEAEKEHNGKIKAWKSKETALKKAITILTKFSKGGGKKKEGGGAKSDEL